MIGEFPAQKASNAENISIWWRHHVLRFCYVACDWLAVVLPVSLSLRPKILRTKVLMTQKVISIEEHLL